MIVAVLVAIALVMATCSLHYAMLRWLSGGMATISMPPGLRVFVMMVVALAAHVAEIGLYAVTYALAEGALGIGGVDGLTSHDALGYFYFSIVSYTSLGLGDVVPVGHIRFIAGMETLNGLLLIAWSASFLYLAMERLWPWRDCAAPSRPANASAEA